MITITSDNLLEFMKIQSLTQLSNFTGKQQKNYVGQNTPADVALASFPVVMKLHVIQKL